MANRRFNVFPSFHGPDVRETFLSHLRKQFEGNGIIMFNDQEIERSQIIKPELNQAIKESIICIVMLSQNYASSSWCLNELVEILKCKEDLGQIVMTIFYKVNPSDVRKQIGEFGRGFKRSCKGKTEIEIQSWIQALTHVADIEGEHTLNWVNEADMIEKIARDVSDKLNRTSSKDFDEMVGHEAHLKNIKSLLCLKNDEAMIIGIFGPAGIGKTTIARALYNQLSTDFPLKYFMENVKGSYRSVDCNEYGMKLRLQEHIVSKILNQNGMKICHLDVIYQRLKNQKVLIILDYVDHIEQLDALARDVFWFGNGSRIIVTTEDRQLLKQHGVQNASHVDFPSKEEALEIFCRYAFRQSSPLKEFKELAEKVIELCGNLPLGLRVVGSSLRGREEEEWEVMLHRLETSVDRDVERILRVGYESLHEKDQALFLYIAVFFNFKDDDYVKAMLAGSNLDEKHGLKTLIDKSLVHISSEGEIVMHKLLQQVGRQAIHRQEPWKRQVLIDAHQICDVLEYDKGTRDVAGISFDTSEISQVCVSKRAFQRMRNLRFLSVYKTRYDGNENDRVHIPEDLEFPPSLRLLQWEAYPSKSLPLTFHPEYLVELDMQKSQLEKLWEGTQPFANLKKIELMESCHLKELPDLSKATNLETLDLTWCQSLVEIPTSFSNLQKLKKLAMFACSKLEVIPTHMNMESLEFVDMAGCSRLKKFPNFSTNIITIKLSNTEVEEVPASISLWTRLRCLELSCGGNLNTVTDVPKSLTHLNLSYSGIERISDCIKGINWLQHLNLSGCRKLTALPELPPQLMFLSADNCESLKTVFSPFYTPKAQLNFTNCLKLRRQAQRAIIQQSFQHGWALLPGNEVPAEFDYRARGNSLTIHRQEGNKSLSGFTRFKICIVLSPNYIRDYRVSQLLSRRISKSELYPIDDQIKVYRIPKFQTEHLFVFHSDLVEEDNSCEIVFEFSSKLHDFEIVECGVQICTEETIRDIEGSYESESSKEFDDESENSDRIEGEICYSKEDEKHTNCWSWLIQCFDLSDIVRSIGSLVWGRR